MDNAISSTKASGKRNVEETIKRYENEMAELREKQLEERIRLEGNVSALEEKISDKTQRTQKNFVNKMEKNL
jgi:hypothetical protein